MKNIIRIAFMATILSMLFIMSANAQGQVYTIDGKKTVFISENATFEADGTVYNTYEGLVPAFAALGEDGGVIYICDTVIDTTLYGNETIATDGSTPRGHVLVTGYGNDAHLKIAGHISANCGKTTYDNFTLHATNADGGYIYGWYVTGSEETVFGKDFKIHPQDGSNGRILYRTSMKSIQNHRTVFDTSASFTSINIGGYRTQFGSESSQTPALAELVINNIGNTAWSVNAGFSDTADYQNKIYGNINVYINGGTFNTKVINFSNISDANHPKGRVTAIFNNGMGEGFTLGDGFDYMVKSTSGGRTEIKTQAPFGGTPTLILTPDEEGKVPCINGETVIFASNGEFLYTLPAPETSTDAVTAANPEGTLLEVVEITWIDAPTQEIVPEVYIIDGKPCVFLASEKNITINGKNYGAFASLAECFTALGKDGGVTYIYGTVTDTNIKNETVPLDGTAARNHVLIRGWDGNAVLNLTASTTINAGPVTFENVTIYAKDASGNTLSAIYLTGSEETVFGEGCIIPHISDYNGRIYYRSSMKSFTTHKTVFSNNDLTFNTVNIGGYRTVFGSASSDTPALAELVFDGINLRNSINAGFSDKADYQNRIYGNVNIIVNGGLFKIKQVTLANITEANYHTGRTTVIFNNGMNDGWTIAAGVDYVVNSSVGGKVEIKTQAPFGGAPVLKLIPTDNLIPTVNGTALTANSDGEYLYTPEIPKTSTALVTADNPEGTVTETVTVTWVQPVVITECNVSFDLNGGTGTVPETQTITVGENVTLPDGTGISRENHTFLGWNTDKAATEALSAFTAPEEEAVTLYAVWKEKAPEAQVYNYNGKRSVFISNNDLVKLDGVSYGTYPGLREGFAALGTEGGIMYICSYVKDSQKTDMGNESIDGTEHRKHVLITGIDNNSALEFYTQLNINCGKTTIDNVTLHPMTSAGEYTTWYINGGEELIFGENFKTAPYLGGTKSRVLTRTGLKNENVQRMVFNSDARFFNANIGGYRTTLGSGTTMDPALAEIVVNNVTGIDWGICAGFSDASGASGRVYGNINIYVNGGNITSKKITLSNVTSANYPTGRLCAIFNNGMAEGWTVADGFDYIVKSAKGGKVEIAKQAPFGEAPTFEFFPDKEGTTALINGNTYVFPDADGRFLYTPAVPKESTAYITDTNPEGTVTETLNITWTAMANTCKVIFDANGGKGTLPEDYESYIGTTYILPGNSGLTKNDAIFIGWNTDKYATSALESIELTDSGTVKVYAIWKETKPYSTSDYKKYGISGFGIETIPDEEYETNNSVINSVNAAENDALNLAGFETEYAFSIKAFDENDIVIEEYSSLMEFVIPTKLLAHRSAGEYYLIFRDGEKISYNESSDGLIFSDNIPGTYTVVKMNSKAASYTYKLISYNKVSGRYVLALYFEGADASYGTFGLSYNTEMLDFESFIASTDVTLTGEDEGFGTYFSGNGIYRNTWEASNGSYINAENTPVEIGRFVFNAKNTITDNSNLFSKAEFTDAEDVLSKETLETVYDTSEKMYLYAPMLPSTDVYCQPITEHFNFDNVQTVSEIKIKVKLERDFGNEASNGAVITIYSESEVVVSFNEKDIHSVADENGKTILELNTSLTSGVYTIKIEKNGYLTYTSEFMADGESVDLGEITLTGGDIKENIDDVCGDGIIDIDDFIRVLRGFSSDSLPEVRTAVDINEDGVINVTDIAIIKKNFFKTTAD